VLASARSARLCQAVFTAPASWPTTATPPGAWHCQHARAAASGFIGRGPRLRRSCLLSRGADRFSRGKKCELLPVLSGKRACCSQPENGCMAIEHKSAHLP